MRSMILVFFAALCATGAQAVAAAPATEQAQLRVIRTFPADSPAVSQVHRWLLEQPAKMRPPATAAALGQVRTSYVMHASDPARRALLTRTDVAFPERGQTGDAVSIDSCAGDTRLHWTYRWDATSAHGWQLQARNWSACRTARPRWLHCLAPHRRVESRMSQTRPRTHRRGFHAG